MPLCTLRLERIGPVIELAVSPDHPTRQWMLANRFDPPNPMVARFLVDTGAAMTKVEKSKGTERIYYFTSLILYIPAYLNISSVPLFSRWASGRLDKEGRTDKVHK